MAYRQTSSAHYGRVQGASSAVSPRVQGVTTSHSELGSALHRRQFVVAPCLYGLPLPSHLINQTFQLSTVNTLSRASSRSQTPSPQTFTLRYRFTPLDFPNGARLCPFQRLPTEAWGELSCAVVSSVCSHVLPQDHNHVTL